MKIRSQIVSKAVFVALSLAASSIALAGPQQWDKGGHHNQGRDRYENRDFGRNSGHGFARVVDVDPIVRRVRVSSPQRECWNEARSVSAPSRTVVRSTIVGGVIGAVVGHQVSQRHHDPVAVVGGSLIGAAIGNSIGHSRAEGQGEYREVGHESVQRCQVSYRDEWAEQIDGYRVTYFYHGRHYTARMPYDPGPRIRVDVNIRPDIGGRY